MNKTQYNYLKHYAKGSIIGGSKYKNRVWKNGKWHYVYENENNGNDNNGNKKSDVSLSQLLSKTNNYVNNFANNERKKIENSPKAKGVTAIMNQAIEYADTKNYLKLYQLFSYHYNNLSSAEKEEIRKKYNSTSNYEELEEMAGRMIFKNKSTSYIVTAVIYMYAGDVINSYIGDTKNTVSSKITGAKKYADVKTSTLLNKLKPKKVESKRSKLRKEGKLR